jgi:hypothetical protein
MSAPASHLSTSIASSCCRGSCTACRGTLLVHFTDRGVPCSLLKRLHCCTTHTQWYPVSASAAATWRLRQASMPRYMSWRCFATHMLPAGCAYLAFLQEVLCLRQPILIAGADAWHPAMIRPGNTARPTRPQQHEHSCSAHIDSADGKL